MTADNNGLDGTQGAACADLGREVDTCENGDDVGIEAVRHSDHGRGGVCLTELAGLPDAALVDERALAACLRTSTRTLRRMVHRGEIPQGLKLGGRRMWLAGKVRNYLSEQAERLTNDAKRIARHFVLTGS